MQYVILLGLAILALYVLSRLLIVAILEPLFALAGSVIGLLILLTVLGSMTAGLHELGRCLSRVWPKRGAMYAMALLTVSWIVSFAYFYNSIGKWEPHIFTKDIWKPNWLLILIFQAIVSLWSFVSVAVGLDANKKGQSSNTEAPPPC